MPTDLRRLALSLPEAAEGDDHGQPAYLVGKKIFCTVGEGGRATVRLDPEDQRNLEAAGAVEPVPGYWGRAPRLAGPGVGGPARHAAAPGLGRRRAQAAAGLTLGDVRTPFARFVVEEPGGFAASRRAETVAGWRARVQEAPHPFGDLPHDHPRGRVRL